jgi:hypothetical protein
MSTRASVAEEGRGNEGRRGAAVEEGEGRVGEALHGRENKNTKEMKVFHWGRRPSLEPRRKPSIDGDSEVRSINQMHCDEALDETNAAVPSDSADDVWIGSNCSPELEPLRTSATNSGS